MLFKHAGSSPPSRSPRTGASDRRAPASSTSASAHPAPRTAGEANDLARKGLRQSARRFVHGEIVCRDTPDLRGGREVERVRLAAGDDAHRRGGDDRAAGRVAFVGFNMTFLSQFILGARGMPRRYYNYLDQFQPLHAFSSVGAYVLGFGFLLSAICLFGSLRKKEDAPDNPWGGTTLEWKTSSPPPTENFLDQPVINAGPYDRN